MSLTALPNELLIHTFTHLPPEDLTNLTHLCRALYYTAFPVYIANLLRCRPESFASGEVRRVSVSYTWAGESPTPLLTALASASFIKSLRSLHVRFSCEFPNFIQSQLRMILRVIRKLERVLRIELEFQIYPYSSREITPPNAGDESDIPPLLLELVQALTQRGCVSLSLRCPDFLNCWKLPELKRQAIVLDNPEPETVSKASRGLRKSLNLFAPKFTSDGLKGNNSRFPQVIPIINNSSLTALCIGSTQNELSKTSFSSSIPSLRLTNLLSLSISYCGLTFNDLAIFLTNHPRLQELHFRGLEEGLRFIPSQPGKELSSREGFLPELMALDAPDEYISSLIAHDHALPKLQRLSTYSTVKGSLPRGYPLIPVVLQDSCKLLDPLVPSLLTRGIELTLELEVQTNRPLPGFWINEPNIPLPIYLQNMTTLRFAYPYGNSFVWVENALPRHSFAGMHNLRRIIVTGTESNLNVLFPSMAGNPPEFDAGEVKTLEELGAQVETPSHPAVTLLRSWINTICPRVRLEDIVVLIDLGGAVYNHKPLNDENWLIVK